MEHETLNKTLNKLNEIPLLNCGGCAIVGYALSKYLRSNNEKCEVYYLFEDDYEAYRFDNKKKLSCAHCVIKYKGHFYDSEGCVDDEVKEHYRRKVTFKFLRESINDSFEWNPMFEREKGIPMIEKYLGVDLSEIVP